MKTIKNYIKEQLHEELCYMYDDINESGGLYKGQIELLSFYVMNLNLIYLNIKIKNSY